MAAENALREMSEIIASHPVKRIQGPCGPTDDKQQNPPDPLDQDSLPTSPYEDMLAIKAFSVACLQDLKRSFEAVQAEYFRNISNESQGKTATTAPTGQ